MKLVTVQPKAGGTARFGFIDENSVFVLQEYASAAEYLKHLPASQKHVHEIFLSGKGKNGISLSEVRFLAPVPHPPMLLDFSLAPSHLEKALDTLLKREYNPFMSWIMKKMFRSSSKRKKAMGMLDYYKANHLAVSGDGDEVFWPDYTAFLDYECELGVVIGTREQPIAGYLILNDWSARDVQMPEMFSLSLTRSKDFAKSYGLGPWLVTPDEIPDPLNLKARVIVPGKFDFEGSTSGYSIHPRQTIEYLRTMFDPAPGTVFGMGTIPNLCGLEHDLWISPGDEVQLSIEGLGTLRQYAPRKNIGNAVSRWKK